MLPSKEMTNKKAMFLPIYSRFLPVIPIAPIARERASHTSSVFCVLLCAGRWSKASLSHTGLRDGQRVATLVCFHILWTSCLSGSPAQDWPWSISTLPTAGKISRGTCLSCDKHCKQQREHVSVHHGPQKQSTLGVWASTVTHRPHDRPRLYHLVPSWTCVSRL